MNDHKEDSVIVSDQVAGLEGDDAVLPWADAEFRMNPYPLYAELRTAAPVCIDNGMYLVSRYEDVLRYGRHAAMRVEPEWEQAGPWSVNQNTMIGRDEPAHTHLKRQSSKWFTPKLIEQWVKTTADVVNELLDSMGPDGRIDGWKDLSVVPTHRTMCRVLGLPDSDIEIVRDKMATTMPMLSVVPREGDIERAQDAFDYFLDMTAVMIEEKRRAPGDGLADSLLAAQDRGEISADEASATIMLFYTLGHMDVGYVVASGLHLFAEQPEVFDTFRREPAAREAIVNEIIRLDPPELSFVRRTLEDLTVSGVEIPADSSIRFMIGSANRDPDVFTNPDTFDHTRPAEASKNLSFGVGAKTCAAELISREETKAIFETVAARFSRIEVAGEVTVEHTDFSRHYTSLPLILS